MSLACAGHVGKTKWDGTIQTKILKDMNCNKVNEFSIVSFLQSHGIEPARVGTKEVWYLSPIRVENTPSFKVDIRLNRWYDHGLGQGGKLVDLGIRILGISVKEFLRIMERNQFGEVNISKSPSSTEPRVILERVKELEHAALLRYLIFRNITLPVARSYCSEVHYSINDRRFFGIGLKNDVGGMEIRNPYFKGCIGKKGITSIPSESSNFVLFEGFFDFLSGVQIGLVSKAESIIVLNSVNQLASAITLLGQVSPKSIKVFFDNDHSGKSCFTSLRHEFPFAEDQSSYYSNFKDLNEMIIKAEI